VVERVVRSNIPATAPGAIYLSQDGKTNSTFNGNGFTIDGNDHLLSGGLANPNHPVPGISTRNDTNTHEAIDSLDSGQRDNVTGLGFIAGPSPVPSILTSPAAPSTDQLNQFANDLISRPGVVVTPMTQVTGGLPPFGTTEHPQITYFNDPSGVTVKGAGNVEGVGILIVEGDLTIQGSLSFSGLIIVRGRTRVIGTTTDTGNATLYGALWTNDLNLTIGGSAVMNYSSAALAFANQASGGMTLPTPVQLTSLIDCSQAVAGHSHGRNPADRGRPAGRPPAGDRAERELPGELQRRSRLVHDRALGGGQLGRRLRAPASSHGRAARHGVARQPRLRHAGHARRAGDGPGHR